MYKVKLHNTNLCFLYVIFNVKNKKKMGPKKTVAAARMDKLAKKGLQEKTTYTKYGPVTSIVKNPAAKPTAPKPAKQTAAAKRIDSLSRKGLMEKTIQTRLGPVTSVVKSRKK